MSDFDSYENFKKEAEDRGYYINNDKEFVQSLLDSIKVNINRYGYASCPCRLASGVKLEDLDLICPCDYRDSDLVEYGACFCALYVSEDVLNGNLKLKSIPDRRIKTLKSKKEEVSAMMNGQPNAGVPIWRCKVCGYLCGREDPPLKCPICKAESLRFEHICNR